MAKTIAITGKTLTPAEVVDVSRHGYRVSLPAATLARAKRSKTLLDKAAQKKILYGVNTGFGPMASRLIGKDSLAQLQLNLIRSHAVGAGEPVKAEYVFAAMLVRLNTLARGYSGVSAKLLSYLQIFINERVIPVVPEHGGVGASGDLIQLAHIALAIIGEGEVLWRNKRMSAADALKRLRLSPYVLQPKEGLALINGTSYMTGIAALILADMKTSLSIAVRSSALAFELGHCFDDSIAPALHAMRPHSGQVKIAELLRSLTRGSKLLRSRSAFEHTRKLSSDVQHMETSAQDVYSLRCTPQIIGPMIEALRESEHVIEIEMNSATDNPLIDTKSGAFLHGGNFHGEYVAAAMDRVKLALAKLSMLSERRLNFFLTPALNRLYTPFLNLGTPGLTLGLQGLQFVATSTAAQNQTLAYPHSLHSIPSNGDNQDVVSMGADAAFFAAQVGDNTRIVLAIELLALSQAAAIGKEENKLSAESKKLLKKIRTVCRPVTKDRSLRDDLARIQKLLADGEQFELPL